MAKLLSQALGTNMPTADTGEGVLLGTAQYMCPEQLRGESVEPSWDVWAPAVIAYEMLTGTHPFLAATVAGVHAAVLQGRYKPVHEALPGASVGLDDFFASALDTDRARRPDSANDFLLRFEQSVSAARVRRA